MRIILTARESEMGDNTLLEKNRILAVLEQYKQCYESFRFHDRQIWQIQSLLVLIVSAIIVAAYKYLGDNPIGKVSVLFVGFVLCCSMTVAVFKHSYFSRIEQGTLSCIEKELGLKLVQRAFINDHLKELEKKYSSMTKDDFWYYWPPSRLERLHAHGFMKWCCVAITILMLVLTLYETLTGLLGIELSIKI